MTLNLSFVQRISWSTQASCRRLCSTPSGLSKPDLLPLLSGVPEGRNNDELVAVPLGGLAELHVERFSCRGDHLAVGQDHLPSEGPRCAGDNSDPVAGPILDRVRVA